MTVEPLGKGLYKLPYLIGVPMQLYVSNQGGVDFQSFWSF